tara:strand:- start:5172 stop:5438 length:267 start_codon:yes stop_codon:yes gene_type:complete
MNPFEQNSIHLNGAGYKFGIAKLQGAVTQSLTGFSLIEVAPMWVNTDRTTDEMLYAIMGSEPKIGENKEVGIPQIEVKKIIYAEPVKI